MRREPRSSSIPTPRFNQGHCNPEHFVSYERNLVSQWYDGLPEISNLGKFPNSSGISELGKVNFKTEICAKQRFFTMQWVKEVEVAKSIDDLFDIAVN